MVEVDRLTRERDRERKHVARLMRDLQSVRERADKAEARLRAMPVTAALLERNRKALEYASQCLDNIVAHDDEDDDGEGHSATCKDCKRLVDSSLAMTVHALHERRSR